MPNCKSPDNYSLTAANGSLIHTYGIIKQKLDIGLRRDFIWNFVVANVNKPILGADFLAHYGILIDCRNRRLFIDSLTTLSTTGQLKHCNQPSVKAISGDSEYHRLLAEYPSLTKPSGLPREFTSDIRHISGKDNITADTLSRIETIAVPPDFEAIAQAQQEDPELQELLANRSSSLKLEKVPVPGLGRALWCTAASHDGLSSSSQFDGGASSPLPESCNHGPQQHEVD
ncbi:uncharacterized protein LOC134791053 [Cydia splendana]|uniref:uncharacterized protein LOC134791053 n=1 Tax=Cydia splendana TaxID=1100963 RepID=UPI00300CA3B6